MLWEGRNRKKRRKGKQEDKIPVQELSGAATERQLLGCRGVSATKGRHRCQGPVGRVRNAWHHSGLGSLYRGEDTALNGRWMGEGRGGPGRASRQETGSLSWGWDGERSEHLGLIPGGLTFQVCFRLVKGKAHSARDRCWQGVGRRGGSGQGNLMLKPGAAQWAGRPKFHVPSHATVKSFGI